jgi:hypothetical protein
MKKLIVLIFICVVSAGFFAETAYADVANSGVIVGGSVLILGLIVAVIWVIAFFILKWIRKKNDK